MRSPDSPKHPREPRSGDRVNRIAGAPALAEARSHDDAVGRTQIGKRLLGGAACDEHRHAHRVLEQWVVSLEGESSRGGGRLPARSRRAAARSPGRLRASPEHSSLGFVDPLSRGSSYVRCRLLEPAAVTTRPLERGRPVDGNHLPAITLQLDVHGVM